MKAIYGIYKPYYVVILSSLFSLIIISLIWASYFYRMNLEYKNEVHDSTILAASLTKSFEEHTLRTIKSADQLVMYSKIQYEEHGTRMKMDPLINNTGFISNQLVLLSIIDENGDLKLSNQVPVIFSNIKDREHFKTHIENDTNKPFISKPVLGRSSGKWSIQMTRRINKLDGSFGGIVVASLDPLYFTDFYKQVNLGENSAIALVGRDGTIHAWESGNQCLVGQDMTKIDNELMEKIATNESGYFIAKNNVDGIERLYSYRSLNNFPYILVIGISTQKLFVQYHAIEHEYLLIASILTILLLLGWILITLIFLKSKSAENRSKYLSTHDPLTTLFNRYSFEEKIEEYINDNKKGTILFIDIDNFRIVNDTFGHSIGDCILKLISEKLERERISRKKYKDVIARLSGDEFAIFLHETTLEEGTNIAEMIRKDFDETDIYVNEIDIALSITVSIGVVPVDGVLNAQKLMIYADTALYSAKDNGKNRTVVIQSVDDKNKLSEANDIIRGIKQAIKNNTFVIYYQPVYKIGSEISHYEALIRMKDDNGTLIPPVIFIPLAERFGLMSKIDRWVLTQVLKDMKKNPDMKVFVNISGASLGDAVLLRYIEKTIKSSGIEPSRLGFEITETTAVQDLYQSKQWICKLKKLGCKFALDDFGVGFSSFSYLSELPIDYLKIDGSFVKNLDKDPKQRALIQAVNAVAHALGQETIAEFVENEEILEILKELNVNHGQGYYLGRPEPLK